jgi:hypothetical protein
LCDVIKTVSPAGADDVHAHDFEIIQPSLNLDMLRKNPKNAVPNSCKGCHTEWGKDDAGYKAGTNAHESLFLK